MSNSTELNGDQWNTGEMISMKAFGAGYALAVINLFTPIILSIIDPFFGSFPSIIEKVFAAVFFTVISFLLWIPYGIGLALFSGIGAAVAAGVTGAISASLYKGIPTAKKNGTVFQTIKVVSGVLLGGSLFFVTYFLYTHPVMDRFYNAVVQELPNPAVGLGVIAAGIGFLIGYKVDPRIGLEIADSDQHNNEGGSLLAPFALFGRISTGSVGSTVEGVKAVRRVHMDPKERDIYDLEKELKEIQRQTDQLGNANPSDRQLYILEKKMKDIQRRIDILD